MNWLDWKEIRSNIKFDVVPSPTEIPRITCIAVAGLPNTKKTVFSYKKIYKNFVLGCFIAVGSDDGRIRIFNESWELLYTERHFAVRVTRISFIFGEISFLVLCFTFNAI